MCGRGACTLSAERCCRIAGGARVRGADRLRRRYNLGPQGYVPVVRCQGGGGGEAGAQGNAAEAASETAREVSIMRWGLVPAFAKRMEDYDVFKGGSSTFNARIESAETSGLWRRLLNSKRGVVLFDGFYEWKTAGKTKTPMFIRNRDDYDGHVICSQASKDLDEVLLPAKQPASQAAAAPAEEELPGPRHAPLMLAALFDVWRGARGGGSETAEAGGAAGEAMETATVLTMEPDGTPMFEVHNRMPVFLTPESAALWLDHSQPFGKIVGTIVKASQMHAQKQLLLYEVSSLVSSVKNESPDCIVPKKEMDAKRFSSGLGRFFQQKPAKGGGDEGTAQAAATPTPAPPPQQPAASLAACRPSSREEEDAQVAAALAASLADSQAAAAGTKRPADSTFADRVKAQRRG